jgi:hypothetical protein
MRRFLEPLDFDAVFLDYWIDIVIKEKGFYVDNVYNIVDEYFSISIAPVRSRGRSLVFNNTLSLIWLTPSHCYLLCLI